MRRNIPKVIFLKALSYFIDWFSDVRWWWIWRCHAYVRGTIEWRGYWWTNYGGIAHHLNNLSVHSLHIVGQVKGEEVESLPSWTKVQNLYRSSTQNIQSADQQKWLLHLVEFNYEIIYQASKDNVVENALSHRDNLDTTSPLHLLSISTPISSTLKILLQ